MKILVVDDHPVNLRLLRAQLEAHGIDAVEAVDGVAALEVLRREPVDAIISDILMPRLDGYGLCREVRASEALRHLPFIFHSGTFNSPADEKLCYDIGGDKYLRKPASSEEILAAVREVTASDHRRRQAAPRPASAIMKEYSAQLVNKLAETNARVARANEELVEALGRAQAAESHFRALFEAAADGILVIAADGTCAAANARFAAMMGFAPGTLFGIPVVQFAAASYRPLVAPQVKNVLAGRAYEQMWEMQRKDGSTFPAQVSAAVLPHNEVMVIVRDVTEQRAAQQTLAASERHYRDLFDLALDGIFLLDAGGRYLDVNAAACRMTGYAREELLAMTVAELVAASDAERVAPALSGMAAGSEIRGEWRLRRKDGAVLIVDVSARQRADGRMQAVVRDITERRRAEGALRESERRFSDLMRTVQLVAIMLDDRGNILYCNEFLLRLTDWSGAEVIGCNWFGLFIPPDAAADRKAFEALLKDSPAAWNYESEILTREGERRLIRWNNTVLRSPEGAVIGTASLGEDITERHRAEEVLRRRAEELETFHNLSVGRELQMVELKKEVNALARELGRAAPYDLSFLDRP